MGLNVFQGVVCFIRVRQFITGGEVCMCTKAYLIELNRKQFLHFPLQKSIKGI